MVQPESAVSFHTEFLDSHHAFRQPSQLISGAFGIVPE